MLLFNSVSTTVFQSAYTAASHHSVRHYYICCVTLCDFARPDIAGVLELKEETIESLLAAACLLQLSQVIQVCCNFLMKQLHPSNCLGIRSFADAQGCMDLLNVAHNYTMVRGQTQHNHIYMVWGG